MQNNLPLNWCECKLEDVLEYEQPTKYIVSNTNYSDSGIPVLTAGKSFLLGYTNDTTGVFDKSELPVIIFDDFTTATKLVDFPFKVKSSAMKILHANKNVNILYFYYLMQTIHYKADTHKRYWISEYAKQEVKLPPLAEQKRIVEKIEDIFAKIDEGVGKLKSAQEKIKQYKQSVLHSAFTGRLTNVFMETKKINSLGVVLTGNTPSTSNYEYYAKKDYPFYKPTDLNAGINTRSAIDFVSQKGYDISRKLPKKSILVTCIGATIGKTGLIQREGICNQQINAIIPDENNLPEYIYYYCISNEFQSEIKMNASSTTMPILNKRGFENLNIKLVSFLEQKRIVEEIEKRFEKADNMLEAVEKSLKSAEQLKQSVLKKAFEGKLVPQDPNDEPASVLLDRIKSEKQQNEKAKGKKK